MEEYLLPELPSQITPAGGATIVVPKPVAKPVTATAEASPAQPVATANSVSVAQRRPSAPATQSTPPAESKQERIARPQTTTSSLTGLSIASLMSSTTKSAEQSEKSETQGDKPTYDERCAEKISVNREAVIGAILEERPRFVTAFEGMKVEGHTITVEVPTKALYEEIMRSKTEILLMIVRTAQIVGMIELEVVVNEQIKASRPIKLEDRIQYMTQKSPLILKLKQELDMEYE